MNFVLLAPLGLAALAALVLPILIHLSRRAEQKITVFAALQWISERVRPRRRVRIEQLWLLLLRLLLLTLLAALLAQPALRQIYSPAQAVVAVIPGVDIAAARTIVGSQSGDWRWLAPGFPPIEEPFPPRDVGTASLLRELDVQLANATHLTVVVPNELDGLDGERALLGHKVDWQVITNSTAPASASAQVVSDDPIHIAIRYPTAGDASARNTSLRYLRATVGAWNVDGPARYDLDIEPDTAPVPANSQWLIWLGSEGDGDALPASITQWIERGGIALSIDRKQTTDAPIWRNADGAVLATRRALGGGQLIHLARPLRADALPILLDAGFPQRLRELFGGPAPAPTRAYADAARPEVRNSDVSLPTSPTRPLDRWLVLAIALLAVIERVWATQRRDSAMSIMQRLQLLRATARRLQIAISLLISLPIGIAIVLVVARISHGTPEDVGAVIAAVIACAFASAALAFRAARRIDNAWIVRGLDQRRPDLDDSSDLLFADPAMLAPLDRLQCSRLDHRLSATPLPDLRAAWPRRTIVLALAAAVVVVAMGWSLRFPATQSGLPSITASQTTGKATVTHLEGVVLTISPPAYTGLAARTENAPDAKFPEGSTLSWRLRFDTEPGGVALTFYDGTRLELAGDRTDHDRTDWVGEHRIDTSSLYRIALTAAPPLGDDRLYRLDALADQPPEVRVIAPDKTLTLRDPVQKTWDLAFEAGDDYGISAARLAITLAQGTGENITFKEQSLVLSGEGDSTHQRYRHSLDLATLGISAGDDVIVRLYVRDNHAPNANETRSPSYILRWPLPTGDESSGMEGLVQKTMPAYFRSQRQLIIDTEALLAEKATLQAPHFAERSDQLGVEQKILRLRYGEFLGEEFESNTGIGGDHSDQARSSNPAADQASAVIAEYGDLHDRAEAATLLDPETKRTLKSALAEMWQAELHLRQGEPALALPYENRALVFLKQVQQSTRIYLARVGLELPEIDASRRLSGDRAGLHDPADALLPADAGDRTISALYQALGNWDPSVSSASVPDANPPAASDFKQFDRYVRDHEHDLPDALGVLAASDAVQRDPACTACRSNLKKLLWPLLPIPASTTGLRAQPDAVGTAYLDALESDGGETAVIGVNSMEFVAAGLLAVAAALASWRTLRSNVSARWLLVAGQWLAAALLYCVLFPPALKAFNSNTLTVLTPGVTSAQIAALNSAEAVVALPGAGAPVLADRASAQPTIRSAANAPDLATALRRQPDIARLNVIGGGLPLRDRDSAHGLQIAFDAAPLPSGIVELYPPVSVRSGAIWKVSGRVAAVAGGKVELRDPADAVVDSAALNDDGLFALSGLAKDSGPALFQLRVLASDARVLENLPLPIVASRDEPLRILVLAGGANPELKYLRRWASDAGAQLTTRIALSPGIALHGDADAGNAALDAAQLAAADIVIVDERAWSALSKAEKSLLRAAVRDGLGLMLRITGPLSAEATADWVALGFTIKPIDIARSVSLAATTNNADRPVDLSRWPIAISAEDATALVAASDGAALALLRPEGRGRTAVWWLDDSFRLVLAGHAEQFGSLWSDALARVARARGQPEPAIPAVLRINQRAAICGLANDAMVEGPTLEEPAIHGSAANKTALLVEPSGTPASDNGNDVASAGCAAYWPRSGGWHVLESGPTRKPFFVLDAEQGTALALAENIEATQRMVAAGIIGADVKNATSALPCWPFFLAWLTVIGLVWWRERARPVDITDAY